MTSVATVTIARAAVATGFSANNAIAAGSRFNAAAIYLHGIQGCYGDNGDTAGVVDANDTGYNMAGGRLRISFPTGWTVSNKFVQVHGWRRSRYTKRMPWGT